MSIENNLIPPSPQIQPQSLRPFTKFCCTIGNLPSSYLASMSYEEQLLWLCNYLENTVIPTINNNSEALQEVQNLFVELKNYVDNYFNNLDVQEEINNKLDEMAEDGTLQEIITAYLNSKAIFGFNNIESMKEATNLINGSFAKTLGYYSKNDGGSGLYKIRNITNEDIIDEASIIALSNENLVAELIIEHDTINAKQFGCYGDGEHDDGVLLNKCIEYAIQHNLNVFLNGGTYLSSIPIVLYGGASGEKTFIFEGDGINGSIIKPSQININVIELKALEGNTAEHINIKNISINGDNKGLNGICIKNDLTNSKLENIHIKNCTQYGLTNDIAGTKPNVYLTSFTKIRVDNCSTGIRIVAGASSNTSLNFQDCYVQGCTNAYYLCSIYSTMINCCADGISNHVFSFNYWRGSIISCGSEASGAVRMFNFSHTRAIIIEPLCYGNSSNEQSTHLYLGANSQITVIGGRLMVENNNVSDMPGQLYYLASSSNLNLFDVSFSNYLTDDYSASGRYANIRNYYGSINQRALRHLPFIGIDTSLTNGLINPNHETDNIVNMGNAIYFGFGNSAGTTANGLSMSDNARNVKGDIILSKNPKEIGGIGWIQASDTFQENNRWNAGEFLKIPVILAGESTERPSVNRQIGQCFFDRTLGKPIWWKGSYWVDATGTQMPTPSEE